MTIACKSSHPERISSIGRWLNAGTPPLPRRNGSIALMLVLVLTLLFGTFAICITRRSAQQTRSEADRRGVAVLEAAIAAVTEASIPVQPQGTILRLPVDEDLDRRITIEWTGASSSETKLRATLFQRDQPIQFIDRLVTPPFTKPTS